MQGGGSHLAPALSEADAREQLIHRGIERGALLMLNVVDIASFMESLESDKLLMVFRILPKDIAAEVFAYIDSEQQQQLVTLIGDGEIDWPKFLRLYHDKCEGIPFILEYANNETAEDAFRRVQAFDRQAAQL